jgi:hypothetical protein
MLIDLSLENDCQGSVVVVARTPEIHPPGKLLRDFFIISMQFHFVTLRIISVQVIQEGLPILYIQQIVLHYKLGIIDAIRHQYEV